MEFTAEERVAAWRVPDRHGRWIAAATPTAPTRALFHICDSSSGFQAVFSSDVTTFPFVVRGRGRYGFIKVNAP